jgi:uncharacterized protein (TIGR03000 family)
MYSIVLMMALSGGAAETPAHCHGGNRCNGGGWSGGCHGGCHGGGLFSHRSRGCHGGNGCHASSSCHGSRGCHGGGLFAHRSHGCHGGNGCNGGYGCHASSSCCGTVVDHGCHGAPAGGQAMPAPGKAPEPIKALPKPTGEEANIPTPATIVVTLPAEAKLTVDGDATTSTSAIRVFASPVLERNKTFYYTLNGELVRDGQVLKTSQRVAVRAGEETRVELQFPIAVLAQR